MKRLLLTLSMALLCAASHGQDSLSLAEALRRIDQAQDGYRIHFVFDDLEDYHVRRSSVKGDAPRAVRAVCKGLPVRVERMERDIFVEATEKIDTTQRVNILCCVEDDFLKVGLPEAKVSVLEMDSSTVVVDSAGVFRLYGAHNRIVRASFFAAVPRRKHDYMLRAQLEGYGDVWRQVSVSDLRAKDVDAGTIGMLRMRTASMKEVVVTATKIKMYWRGDTLVYDATAFKLPDGSMLDDLIRQMDGVRLTDEGEIFVNGRKVDELLLGSRTFMGGNRKVLLQNLPYYTVKDIKVYEKSTDRSEALGYDIDPKRYVMDVNLKPEYQTGYIANVEAAGGWSPPVGGARPSAPSLGEGGAGVWLGRAFLLGFTDRTRYSLVANANNVNETRHIGQQGNWTPARMPRELITTYSVKGEVDYQRTDKKVRDVLRTEYASRDNHIEMRQRKELLLASRLPVAFTQQTKKARNQRIEVSNELTLKVPTWMYICTRYNYQHFDESSASQQEHSDDDLITHLRANSLLEGHRWELYGGIQGDIPLGKNVKNRGTSYFFDLRHQEEATQSAQRYETATVPSGSATGSPSLSHNATDYSNRSTYAHLNLEYANCYEPNRTRLALRNVTTVSDRRTHDWLFHPDTLALPSTLAPNLTLCSRRAALPALTDPHNSYDSHLTSVENTLSLNYYLWHTYELAPGLSTGYPRLHAGIDIPLHAQRLDYQRAALDTLAMQTFLFVNPFLNLTQQAGKGKVELRANFRMSAPELTDRLTIRDTRMPLVVQLGNPSLRPIMRSQLFVSYSTHPGNFERPKSSTLWRVAADFAYQHRDVAQAVMYDPQSGIYTYQPRNVGGAYLPALQGDITCTLDKKKRWTWQTSLHATLRHDVDYVMLADETISRLNKVNTLTLLDNSYIQYSRDALNLRATGEVRSILTPGCRLLDYHYGLSARYTLPGWKATLSADATLYSRRGYGSPALNADDFVLNASLSQPLLKGKLIARLEAFDLLHQLSSTRFEVNGQGRIETWYRSLPHYVMAHLAYHWSRSPRKR